MTKMQEEYQNGARIALEFAERVLREPAKFGPAEIGTAQRTFRRLGMLEKAAALARETP